MWYFIILNQDITVLCFSIKVTFNKANGDKIIAEGKKGDSLLDVIINNNLDFDGYGMILKLLPKISIY